MVLDKQTLAVCHRAAGAGGETSSGGSSHWDSDHLLTVHKHTCVVYKKRRWMLLYSQNLLFDLRDALWPQQTNDWPPPPHPPKKTLKLYLHPFHLFSHLNHQEPLKTGDFEDGSPSSWTGINQPHCKVLGGFFGSFFSPRQLNFVFWWRKVHMV